MILLQVSCPTLGILVNSIAVTLGVGDCWPWSCNREDGQSGRGNPVRWPKQARDENFQIVPSLASQMSSPPKFFRGYANHINSKSMIRNVSIRGIRDVRRATPAVSCTRLAYITTSSLTSFGACTNHRANDLRNGLQCTAGAVRPLQRSWISSIGSRYYPETIYALSTAPGRAAIATIRMSGPGCHWIYDHLCPGKPYPLPRRATVRTLRHPQDPDNILDPSALVLSFLAEKSVTGEPMLELHVHGGPAIVKSVLSAIPLGKSEEYPIRYAEPGEFTRRAFQNNRLDLAEVESLSDALSAETEQQRLAAVRGHSAKLGETYEEWRHQLTEARGKLEAIIDFSESENFDEEQEDLLIDIVKQIDKIGLNIEKHIHASTHTELVKKGIRISLLGPPNAGKSSLLNYIVGREASIVSQEAGTTRDIVEVNLDVRGYLCRFADTAGLRSISTLNTSSDVTIGAIEQEGIRRAKAKASESDIIMVLASVENTPKGISIQYDPESLKLAAAAQASLVVINKVDLVTENQLNAQLTALRNEISANFPGESRRPKIFSVSCLEAQSNTTELGPGRIERVIDNLAEICGKMTDLPPELEDLYGVTERQKQLLIDCKEHLDKYVEDTFEALQGPSGLDGFDIVLAAEYLRDAANCLSRITGRGEASDVEEVLGVVFEKFCVGK